MGLSMFSAQTSPIAIDFGSSSLKLLQTGGGDRPVLTAAADVPVPQSARASSDALFDFYATKLPTVLGAGKFKGKRAVVAIPSSKTFIQHMQIAALDGTSTDDLVKAQLQVQMGCSPQNVVVRTVDVASVHRDGQSKQETICLAVGRDTVMKYVELLKKCKLEVVGMHTEMLALLRSFDHLNRRDEDSENTTLYVDLGWSGTRVAIAHGRKLVFARHIAFGGRQFDQHISRELNCDIATASAHRLALQDALVAQSASNPATGADVMHQAGTDLHMQKKSPKSVAVTEERRRGVVPAELSHILDPVAAPRLTDKIEVGELLDTITDELSMCLRYHRGLFPDRSIDRAIFLGGESRQTWLCQHVVTQLGVSAQLGDPLARLDRDEKLFTPGLTLGLPQPGWAVACGLSSAPTDL